jgi:hypothetical protein
LEFILTQEYIDSPRELHKNKENENLYNLLLIMNTLIISARAVMNHALICQVNTSSNDYCFLLFNQRNMKVASSVYIPIAYKTYIKTHAE